MGLTIKNNNNYDLSENLANFFSLPIEDDLNRQKKDDYQVLKNKIYKLNIDKEEKANIINKINSLDNSSTKEKKTILSEIAKFQKKYNL